MTRARSLLVRAVVLALVLLTVGSGPATADSTLVGSSQATSLPDDPGYGD